MIYNKYYLADILRVCEIKDLTWVIIAYAQITPIITMIIFVFHLHSYFRYDSLKALSSLRIMEGSTEPLLLAYSMYKD